MIFEKQSGFVQGRLITDNIVIMNEVMQFLKGKRKGKVGVAALKIDIAKAYDKMEWSYLETVMSALWFFCKWIQLMMLYMNLVKFNVLLDGEEIGPIVLEWVLRQGDPLSPYLFIIGVEGLMALINRKAREGKVHGCKISNEAPHITHLFFTDDTFLFFKAM